MPWQGRQQFRPDERSTVAVARINPTVGQIERDRGGWSQLPGFVVMGRLVVGGTSKQSHR
jgi:hypothetical protein